ncbi:MAG: hypothetical protein LBN26_01660 [Christensenellaceae bacterium]|jgi:hypothetical protein|nr:hypothetical protein [Christensenellaceae bacterium]
MKLKALSHYESDLDTRFGDCILLYDNTNLIVYDCGHSKHKDAVVEFLKKNATITAVSIVISHNDSDHTDGIIPLLDYLHEANEFAVTVYSSLYLKSARKVLAVLDDERRTLKATKKRILEKFDNIKAIVEKAQEYGFSVADARVGTMVVDNEIVGPTEDEFVEVVAQAIDDNVVDTIEGETVMNAASVQLKCVLNDGTTVLLCGDASPSFLHNIDGYGIIQLPHHGQLSDAEAVFDNLSNAGSKMFLVSDNTGSGEKSGGSEKLLKSASSKGKRIKNTKDGTVELPEESQYNGGSSITKSGIYITPSQKTGGYGCDIL